MQGPICDAQGLKSKENRKNLLRWSPWPRGAFPLVRIFNAGYACSGADGRVRARRGRAQVGNMSTWRVLIRPYRFVWDLILRVQFRSNGGRRVDQTLRREAAGVGGRGGRRLGNSWAALLRWSYGLEKMAPRCGTSRGRRWRSRRQLLRPGEAIRRRRWRGDSGELRATKLSSNSLHEKFDRGLREMRRAMGTRKRPKRGGGTLSIVGNRGRSAAAVMNFDEEIRGGGEV